MAARGIILTRGRRIAVALTAGGFAAAAALPLVPLTARAQAFPSGVNVSATEATSTGTVPTATFTASDAGPFTANVNWGDGVTDSGVTVNNLGGGNYNVTDAHTYADEGPFTVTTTVFDAADSGVAVTTSTASVAENDSVSATPVTFTPTEAATYAGPVATFTDTNSSITASDFIVAIAWGDGVNTAGTVSGGAGSFTVSGTHIYTGEGSFQVTVSVFDDSPGTAVSTAVSTANVGEADSLSATGMLVSTPIESQSFNGAVGTFTDSNTSNVAGDFTASIGWGDGSFSTGTVSGSGGSYTVSGTHTYAEDGAYTATFTVSDNSPGTATANATSTVNVGENSQQLSVNPFSVAEGAPFSGTVATYRDFGTSDPASDFSATIDWGDGSTSTGTMGGTTGDSLSVDGSHIYADEGSFSVSITVVENDATGPLSSRSITFGFSATVTEVDSVSATPVTIAPSEGTQFTGTVATFTDSNTGALASDFAVSVNWGDGTTTAGVVSGGGGAFTVTGTHTYADENSYPLTVIVSDDAPSTAVSTASGTANVGEADSTAVTMAHIAPVEGAAFSGTVATFSDSNTGNFAGDFTASIDWGDGHVSNGTISGSAGSFTVTGTHTYAEEGTFSRSVTIADDAPGTGTAASTLSTVVADAALSAAPGSSFNGVENVPAGGTLATFSDGDPNGIAGDYTATVHWGDGTSSPGTVTATGGGGFKVNATHSYANNDGSAGPYGITVTIADAGGATATASLSATIISGQGYWELGQDGGVFTFGNAPFFGSTPPLQPGARLVGIAGTPDHGGYWLASSNGGVVAFGNARFHGDLHLVNLAQPIVGIVATPSGNGYYLVAADGGVFALGDAVFHGSTGGTRLNKPIVGMALTPDGGGYYLVAADGGVFTFGDAAFHGSTGGTPLNQPIVGMAVTAGGGYYLVAADGGVFTFGGAVFRGSTGGTRLNQPVVAILLTPDGGGYWLIAADGGVFTFGDAVYLGGMGGTPLAAPVDGAAGT